MTRCPGFVGDKSPARGFLTGGENQPGIEGRLFVLGLNPILLGMGDDAFGDV
jgi:hypothetical protein